METGTGAATGAGAAAGGGAFFPMAIFAILPLMPMEKKGGSGGEEMSGVGGRWGREEGEGVGGGGCLDDEEVANQDKWGSVTRTGKIMFGVYDTCTV